VALPAVNPSLKYQQRNRENSSPHPVWRLVQDPNIEERDEGNPSRAPDQRNSTQNRQTRYDLAAIIVRPKIPMPADTITSADHRDRGRCMTTAPRTAPSPKRCNGLIEVSWEGAKYDDVCGGYQATRAM
jgi:hypothetical protein